jgi:hypothetical protein
MAFIRGSAVTFRFLAHACPFRPTQRAATVLEVKADVAFYAVGGENVIRCGKVAGHAPWR